MTAVRNVLKADRRIDLHYSASDWVTVRFSSPADMQSVLDLAEAAAAVHCPPPGVTPDPPPTGPDLERRRRFHESFGSLLAAPDVPLCIRRSRS